MCMAPRGSAGLTDANPQEPIESLPGGQVLDMNEEHKRNIIWGGCTQ